MIRIYLIAIFGVLLSSTASGQKNQIDTLNTGFNKASSLTVGNDAIYVVENGAHRISKLDMNGNLLEKYGKRGSSNYQFDNPIDITTTNGLKLFVSDKGNNRIQVFDKRWQYLSSIFGNERFQTNSEITPTFLGVNKLGEVYFYDEKARTLGKYNEDGAILDQIPLPGEVKQVSEIQVAEGSIFILDKKSALIHRISENGFYTSFYKAENTSSFVYTEKGMFVATTNAIVKHLSLTKVTIRSFEKNVEIRDLYVLEDKIYILTSKELIRVIAK